MSFSFKANILYCRQPQRMLRLLVDLFEASYYPKEDYLVVDLDGARFLLKELPKKEQLEIVNEHPKNTTPQMSFCLTTADRNLLNELEERFQFFLFKESSDLNVREKISHLKNAENEGIIIMDDDGRSWSILLENLAPKELSERDEVANYDYFMQKLENESLL